jgi:hypothetical protein
LKLQNGACSFFPARHEDAATQRRNSGIAGVSALSVKMKYLTQAIDPKQVFFAPVVPADLPRPVSWW